MKNEDKNLKGEVKRDHDKISKLEEMVTKLARVATASKREYDKGYGRN